nr:retinoschisin-like [Lytechinus pictus]
MEDGRIQDDQLTQSSCWNEYHCAFRARLNIQDEDGVGIGGWVPDWRDHSPWIQVDLRETKLVGGVMTQGRTQHNNVFRSFSVSYGINDSNWVFAKDRRNSETFISNYDEDTIVVNYFDKPVTARHVKLNFLFDASYPGALRMEILEFLPNYGPGISQLDIEPLGMEDSAILNESLDASSERLLVSFARLNGPSGWMPEPSPDDSNPWIQADIGVLRDIIGVQLQGNADDDNWVTTYRVRLSINGSVWNDGVNIKGSEV